MPTLYLNTPLKHQQPIDQSTARWKVWRGGRRSGKTEWAAKAAVDGHGPLTNGRPLFSGLLQGRDVIWLVRDYKQSEIFWHEFVVPTFAEVGTTNASDRVVDVGTGGRLWIRSSENIPSVRGIGKNLGGVIFEEAAFYATLDAFRREIRPMLMDNKGWAAWVSSTHAGSEFNLLCQEVLEGKRSAADGWAHFHTTPFDNPLLDPTEIQALIHEYPADSDTLKEEVFAELLGGGAGLAFPEWRTDLHTKRIEPLTGEASPVAGWIATAGLDWGFDPDDGVVLGGLHGPDDRWHLCFEYVFRRKTPEDVGHELALLFLQQNFYPDWIAYDPSMGATRDGGPTILENVQIGFAGVLPNVRMGWVPAPTGRRGPRGETSREIGKLLIHQALTYKADVNGLVQPQGMPRLSVDPVRCPIFTRMMPALVRDPKKPSDVLTVGQWEHGYDAARYIQLVRAPHVHGPPEIIPQDIHPGFIPGTSERRARLRTPEVEAQEAQKSLAARGLIQGGRFQRPKLR